MKKIILFLFICLFILNVTGCTSPSENDSSKEKKATKESVSTEPETITALPETTTTTEITTVTEAVTVTDTAAATETAATTENAVTTDNCTTYYYPEGVVDAKPVIYLYPTVKTDVSVSLDYDGRLTTTYPAYNSGWNVTAFPDGTLINHTDNKEYSYLFWEGLDDVKYDMSKGFVVKGEDTAEFLQNTLACLGLTPKEYNEFIVYWLPKMESNAYNLITFQSDCYTEHAKLNITPEPDSILRVFMVYKPLDKPIDIEPQVLPAFSRCGFTVVEWGGTMRNG